MGDMLRSAGELIGVGAGAFVIYVASKIKKILDNNRKTKVARAINKNSQIFENLVSLRATLDCDRVKLFQFYNGDYYTTGRSTLKMHMTYCTVKHGVSYPQGFLYGEGVPVTRVSQILKPLIDEKDHFSIYTSDMGASEWQAACTLNGTLRSLFIRVGQPGSIQAVIVCSYTRLDDISDDAVAFARETAAAISALI